MGPPVVIWSTGSGELALVGASHVILCGFVFAEFGVFEVTLDLSKLNREHAKQYRDLIRHMQNNNNNSILRTKGLTLDHMKVEMILFLPKEDGHQADSAMDGSTNEVKLLGIQPNCDLGWTHFILRDKRASQLAQPAQNDPSAEQRNSLANYTRAEVEIVKQLPLTAVSFFVTRVVSKRSRTLHIDLTSANEIKTLSFKYGGQGLPYDVMIDMFGITKKQPLLSQSFWSAVIGLGQETLFLSKVNENAWVLGHAVYANDVCFALVVNIIPFQESDPLEVRSDNPDNLRALMYRAKLSHEQLISYFNAIQAQDRRCPAQGAHVFVLDVDAHTNATGNITFPPSATQERDNEMGISRLALPCDDSTPLKDYLQSVFRCPRLRIFINNKLITSIIYDTSIPGDVAQAVYRHNANKVLALRLWASKGRGTSTQIVPCIIKLYHNNVLICHYTGPSQTWELHGLIDTKDMPGLKVDLRGTGYDTESEFSLRVLISWMDECIENFVKGLSSSPRSAATSATRWIQCCQCLNHRQMQYDVPITLEAYEKWECCHTPGMSCSQPESTKWMPAEKDSNTEIGTSMHFMRTEPTCLEYSAYHFVEGADLIGHGTFANVYTAVNKETGNPVAIKKFLDNLPSGPDQSIGKMLCREVHAQSCVVHDNVCRVHGYIETPPCLVMDLIPSGDTLHEYVCHTNEDTANMEMSNSKMFHCILQIAECIHACHVMGIVHRDIKPSNIMLLHSSVCGGELMCKLIDFGLTSIMNTEAEKKCRQSSYQGQQRGTLPYKDPVALRGKKSADPFSLDVYAFGVTVLELLTRKDAQFEMKEGFDLSELMLIQQNKIDGNHPIVPRTQVPEHWRILINDCWKSKNRPDMADILLRLRYNEDFQQLDAQLDNHEMDICQAASPGSNAIQDVPIQRSVSVEEGECTDALPSPHAIAHLPGR
ncbi:hypothetical protein CYMTET_36862, partial [Cymbomonas tetramitiformis]